MTDEQYEPLPDPREADDDLDPAIAAAMWRAYSRPVDVDVAARHLWRIHMLARTPRTNGRARRALVTAVVGMMLLLALPGAALAASGNSVPGDPLYGVKRGAERTRLVLAMTPEADARVYLSMARARLSEAEIAAVKRPHVVAQLLVEAADSIERAELAGGIAVASEALAVRDEATRRVEALAGTVELASQPEVAAVGDRLRQLSDVMQEPVTTAVPDVVGEPEAETATATPMDPPAPPAETSTATPDVSASPTPSPSPSPSPSPEPEPTPRDDEGSRTFESDLGDALPPGTSREDAMGSRDYEGGEPPPATSESTTD